MCFMCGFIDPFQSGRSLVCVPKIIFHDYHSVIPRFSLLSASVSRNVIGLISLSELCVCVAFGVRRRTTTFAIQWNKINNNNCERNKYIQCDFGVPFLGYFLVQSFWSLLLLLSSFQ